MRILHLGSIIALTVLVGFFGFQAYALWVPLSTQQLLEQSKTIFVGNITAVTPVEVQYQSQIARNGTVKQSVGPETMTLDEYTVHVEEFLQNPQGYDTINLRQATVGGVPSGPSTIGGFEVGDRVMFFLPKYENQTRFPMQYLPESFKIPQFCNGQDVLAQKRIIGSNNFTVIQNGLKVDYGNFTVNKPIKFLYDKDMNTLFGKRFDVAVGISKANDKGNLAVFSQEIHAGTKPCQWVTSAAWEFTPREDGKYIMTIITKEGNGTGGMSQTPFYVKSDTSVINHKLPLEQFKSGTPASNVKCNDGLQLIIKAEDGSPACVSPGTAQKLVERGWAKNPIDELMLRYTDQTQANQIFYDIMNEKHVLDWSQTGWKYNSYDFASNSAKQTDSATIHLYLPFNETNHPECKNGSQAFVVVNLRPKSIEIESNMTEVGCIPDFNGGGDPQLNKNNQTPSALGLLFSNSTSVKPTQTVLNGTKAVDACNYFGFPCPQNPSFIAQKFDSGIYVAKAEMNGRDYYMLLGGPDKCIYPGIDGHVSCSNPADIAILKLAGANIVNVSEDIDVENHTLTLGDLKYDIASFESNRTVRLDGVTFVYKGNGSAIRGDCYGTWVNQTEGRSFSIYGGNEFDYNAFQCWPPLQYPTQIEENGKILYISPLLYSISFFDINQTVGIAWCSSDTCSMGDGFYLVKQGWNTPTIYDSPSVLKFYLQTNASTIHVGQTVGLYIGDNNTQPRQVKLPFPWYFGFHGSSLFPCDYESTTIAVFHGYLTQENLNNTEPLYLYQPGLYSCPAPYAGKTWTFQALSNVATLQCDIGEYCNDTRTMSQYIPLNGYWDSSDHFHLFEKGNYTIAGGDQWGHVEILHFSVAK